MVMETKQWGRVAVAKRFVLIVDLGLGNKYEIETDDKGKVTYSYELDFINGFREFEDYVKLKKRGKHRSYETPFGFRFEHVGYRGVLRVPLAYHNAEIEGLCADFNFDKTNDFTEKDGTQHPYTDNGFKRTDSEWKTAISWIIEGDPGPDPGVIAEQHKQCVHKPTCQAMFDHSFLDNCKLAVDVSDYIAACEVDYCEVSTDETLEEIYEAFITACKTKIPDDNAICVWKTELGFDSCPSGLVWSGCKPHCEAHASCDTSVTCSSYLKEEGCFCPSGKVMYLGECVATADCPARTCSTVLQEAETTVVFDKSIGSVHMDVQYIFQAEIKFNIFDPTINSWQQVFYGESASCPNHGNPSMFIANPKFAPSNKVLQIQHCSEGVKHYHYFSMNELTGFTVGDWHKWVLGQRRNSESGDYEFFISIDGTEIASYPNISPELFDVEVFIGRNLPHLPNNEWIPADVGLQNIAFHTSPDFLDIEHCVTDSWQEWGECSASCAGGTRTRTGVKGGLPATEERVCNMEACPFLPGNFPECSCPDDKWVCANQCANKKQTCQRSSLELDTWHCLPANFGRCYAWGDPHVVTFDSANNDVYGVANYRFAQVKNSEIGTILDNKFNKLRWEMHMKTRPWGRVSFRVLKCNFT